MMERRRDQIVEDVQPSWDAIARGAEHRPWPPPSRPWIVAQSWRNLLFAHWPVSPALLRPMLPAGLALDTFAGDAWIGVVPFRISSIAPRGAPRPAHAAFPELNVRTYVTIEGKPGVWFFSLDAASVLAVISARVAFHLPYYWARMAMVEHQGWIGFTSRRRHPGAPMAHFAGQYKPIGPVFQSARGSLEAWLTERYCLYASTRDGRLFRTDILHAPWPLQEAVADIADNTMVSVQGIDLFGSPLLHFARALDVVTWAPEVVSRGVERKPTRRRDGKPTADS